MCLKDYQDKQVYIQFRQGFCFAASTLFSDDQISTICNQSIVRVVWP